MNSKLPDQIAMWDRKHGDGDHDKLRAVPSPLAELTAPYLKPQSYILELGCGVGRDSIYFAEMGHTVVATDGSKVVIEQDKQRTSHPRLKFEVLDISREFPYPEASFDVVYANLSIHYFQDDKTREIYRKITRL